MGEHGILFQDEMVRALLRSPDNPLRKTVTRRTSDRWAKVKPGDLLWVRECWVPTAEGCRQPYLYRANYGAELEQARKDGRMTLRELGAAANHWRPSILMPRRASRLTLRVVDVRREQALGGGLCTIVLPEVDDAEARREGVEDRAAYLALWESINGAVYPEWVWRIEFEEVSRG